MRWTCATPMAYCSGAIDKHDTRKSHASPEDVRKCYLRYLDGIDDAASLSSDGTQRCVPHIWVVEILEDGEWVTTDNAGASLSSVQKQADTWKYCGAEARVRRYVREED